MIINTKFLTTTRSLQNGIYYTIDKPGTSYGVPSNDPTSQGSGGGGSSDGHTHPNLDLLNKLKLDSNSRLMVATNLVNPPLLQEEW